MPKHIDRTGETHIAKNGLCMKIIECPNSHNMVVEFEDGTIVTKVKYNLFCKGIVKHPGIDPRIKPKPLGEVYMSDCGMKMTLIAYRTVRDIDIQFEDGTVVSHIQYSAFKSGHIKNPNCGYYGYAKKRWLGQTFIAHNGLNMSIIDYKGTDDITVQFEDGCIVPHQSLGSIKRGQVLHPKLQYENGKLKYPHIRESFVVENLAYQYRSASNYYCHCTKCGHKDIMTIPEMKSHICNI